LNLSSQVFYDHFPLLCFIKLCCSGLQTKFQEALLHTSKYDTSFDPTGKKIAIIGNGASGQQLLPNIISKTTHIDHYVRSKTWVSPSFRGDMVTPTAKLPGGPLYTEEQKAEWKQNPASYLAFGRGLETKAHGRFHGSILGSPENEATRQRCIETMRERLNGDEEWLQKLLLDYAPSCKRPTPAPGYLEALISSKAEFITDQIVEAVEIGLVTADRKLREVDAIIAATGHTDGFSPSYPTVGRNGLTSARFGQQMVRLDTLRRTSE
jgi:cation diffusion facilitator CzcD-associated flavoprotein CzcO